MTTVAELFADFARTENERLSNDRWCALHRAGLVFDEVTRLRPVLAAIAFVAVGVVVMRP